MDKHLELSSKVAKKLIEKRKSVLIILKKVEEKWEFDQESIDQNENMNINASLNHTIESHQIITRVPFMLKHSLREYQHIGLD